MCIGGACVKRQVPEGAPCGVESLCQSRGRCVSGRCDQPDASVLLPEWAYEPSVSGIDLVGLVADGRGDFFTVECQPFGLGTFTVRCSLVSFSPTGQERWRTPFPRNLYVGTGALTDSLTVAEESVISWVERSFVSAFDVTTGAHRWTTNLATNGAFPSGVGWVRMRALSADGAGRLSIAAEGYSPNGGVFSSAYVELDAVTGALLRTHPLPHEGFSLLQDRRAVTSVAHALQPAGAQLREAVSTFDQGGQLRWQRVVPISNLRVRTLSATHQGLLAVTQLDQLELLDASNGALTRQVRLPGNAFGAPVWSDRRFFSFLQVCLRSPCRSFPEFDYQLLALDVRTASSAGAFLPPLNDLSSPWLTQRGTPLFTVWTRAGWAELFEFDEAASLVMRCPLPRFVGALGSGPVLTDGRYGILTRRDSSGGGRISVWALPGYRPAASGWISGGGGPGHDGRAR